MLTPDPTTTPSERPMHAEGATATPKQNMNEADPLDDFVPRQITLYGETTLRNLLRMGSGARFVEDYSGKDVSRVAFLV